MLEARLLQSPIPPIVKGLRPDDTPSSIGFLNHSPAVDIHDPPHNWLSVGEGAAEEEVEVAEGAVATFVLVGLLFVVYVGIFLVDVVVWLGRDSCAAYLLVFLH